MAKKIITVNGEISEDDLGITLPHEHLFTNLRASWKGETKEIIEREIIGQPVNLNNRGEVIYKAFDFLDNLYHVDMDNAIEETNIFKQFGGDTIVDLTTIDLGRDPKAIYSVASTTGLNIVMGTGYYSSHTGAEIIDNSSEVEITNKIIKEFENGVGTTGIKPGIIGEIAVWDFNNELDIKNLRASAKAQREIGCGLNIHQPLWEENGNKILDILEKESVNLEKVVISHCDTTIDDMDYHEALAKRGVYVEYDLFGAEFMSYEGKFLPSDGDRIKAIKELIKRGYLDHILISHDACHKISFVRWGGWGYGHILRHIIPRLRQEGLKEDQISTIIKENPKRLLSF
jgi:Predicted metal-dependent hydrolase with the TIM-barrel fold